MWKHIGSYAVDVHDSEVILGCYCGMLPAVLEPVRKAEENPHHGEFSLAFFSYRGRRKALNVIGA